jgi:hypothetical protein
MKAEYQRRRNFIHASFNEMGVPCPKPTGAFYAFPKIGHLGLTSKAFALRLLDEEKVAVVPGTAFGPCGEGFVRCRLRHRHGRFEGGHEPPPTLHQTPGLNPAPPTRGNRAKSPPFLAFLGTYPQRRHDISPINEE